MRDASILHPASLILHRLGSGGWIRTNDLRVMSPTSYHCSTPRRYCQYGRTASSGAKYGLGTGLFSHPVAQAVSSALGRFTSVFGMGTGGTTPLSPPRPYCCPCDTRRMLQIPQNAREPVRRKQEAGGRRESGEPLGPWNRSAARIAALGRAAHRPASLAGALLCQAEGGTHLGACFALRCCQRLSRPDDGYPAVLLAEQPVHRRSVRPGPLVLGAGPRSPPSPATDRDRTVSRRSEPSSRAALMGEQPNPWDLLRPQDATSRHRGAKQPRRCELLAAISLLSPEYLLSVERRHFHSLPPDH